MFHYFQSKLIILWRTVLAKLLKTLDKEPKNISQTGPDVKGARGGSWPPAKSFAKVFPQQFLSQL